MSEIERERIAEAVQVARWDYQRGKFTGPDTFYAGVTHAALIVCSGDHIGTHGTRARVLAGGTSGIPLGCYDCGLLYGGTGWCDAVIPTDVWIQISPTGDEGGVLCLTCMARRLVDQGIEDVPLKVTSGPWRKEST